LLLLQEQKFLFFKGLNGQRLELCSKEASAKNAKRKGRSFVVTALKSAVFSHLKQSYYFDIHSHGKP